jgi:hypothetical protein
MEGFWEAVEYCGFRDLGFFFCLPYTWDNRWESAANIKVRLDQTLADASWLDMFASSVVQHIQLSQSDHCGV